MSHKQDKAFEHLLKAELRKESAGGVSPCPDDNQMAAYLEKKLPLEQLAFLESHLNSCPDCRGQLSLLLCMKESLEDQIQVPQAKTSIGVWNAAWNWFQGQGLKPAFALLIIAVISTYLGIRVFEKSGQEKEADRMKRIDRAAQAPEPSSLATSGGSSSALKTAVSPSDEKAILKPTERGKAEPCAKSAKKAALAESGQPATAELNAPAAQLSGPAEPLADASSPEKLSSSRMDSMQSPPANEIKKDSDHGGVSTFSKPRSISELPRPVAILVAGNESAEGAAFHSATKDSKEAGTKSIQTDQTPAAPLPPKKVEAKLREASEKQTMLSLDKEPREQRASGNIVALQKTKGASSAQRVIQGKTFELRNQRWVDLSILSGEMNSFQTLAFEAGATTGVPPQFQPFLALLSEQTPILIKIDGKIFLLRTR